MEPDQAMETLNQLAGSSPCPLSITLTSNVYMKDSKGRVRYTLPINLNAEIKRDSLTGKYMLSTRTNVPETQCAATSPILTLKEDEGPLMKPLPTAPKTMKLVWTDRGLTALSLLASKEEEKIWNSYIQQFYPDVLDQTSGRILRPEPPCSSTGEESTRCKMRSAVKRSVDGRPKSMSPGGLLELERRISAMSPSTKKPTSSPVLAPSVSPSGGTTTMDSQMLSSTTIVEQFAGTISSSSWMNDPAEWTIVEGLLNCWPDEYSLPPTNDQKTGTLMTQDPLTPCCDDLPWSTTWNDEKIDLDLIGD